MTPSSKGNDSLIAGAVVTVTLGLAQELAGIRFEYPGFEAALVVLASFGYARCAAWHRSRNG